jgi:hypothetical protein
MRAFWRLALIVRVFAASKGKKANSNPQHVVDERVLNVVSCVLVADR